MKKFVVVKEHLSCTFLSLRGIADLSICYTHSSPLLTPHAFHTAGAFCDICSAPVPSPFHKRIQSLPYQHNYRSGRCARRSNNQASAVSWSVYEFVSMRLVAARKYIIPCCRKSWFPGKPASWMPMTYIASAIGRFLSSTTLESHAALRACVEPIPACVRTIPPMSVSFSQGGSSGRLLTINNPFRR